MEQGDYRPGRVRPECERFSDRAPRHSRKVNENFSLVNFPISLQLFDTLCSTQHQKIHMTTPPPGSLRNPYTGKAFKESMVPLLDALVNQCSDFLHHDKYRLHIKFANGRQAIVEAREEDEEFDEDHEPLLVHEVKYQQIRANWTSVSAAIVFGIAFAFEYKNLTGKLVRLVLYKSEQHTSDDFVQSIVADMQISLEFDAFQEIGERMEVGFQRIEKLIKLKIK